MACYTCILRGGGTLKASLLNIFQPPDFSLLFIIFWFLSSVIYQIVYVILLQYLLRQDLELFYLNRLPFDSN